MKQQNMWCASSEKLDLQVRHRSFPNVHVDALLLDEYNFITSIVVIFSSVFNSKAGYPYSY